MLAMDLRHRKRPRDEDFEDLTTAGFREHRTKRRMVSLPHRTPPIVKRQQPPTLGLNYVPAPAPAPATITPADSDSENTPVAQKSAFSPWSSSPAYVNPPMSGSSPCINNSQSTLLSDGPAYSDDLEMTDCLAMSPGPPPTDLLANSGRVPTPIHSSFAPFVRPERNPNFHDANFADDEGSVNRTKRGRRLPSPISEGEPSPSIITDNFGGMQMEVETPQSADFERESPTQKGHTRSKHSLRDWNGSDADSNADQAGVKKSFSMGYRSDCEKCRNKVPGHYSHIISY